MSDDAVDAVFKHKALLLSVNESWKIRPPYHATRYAWKLDKAKASQAEVVLAVVDGVVRGAFVADEWLAAIPENFPVDEGFDPIPPDKPRRFGFVGREAHPDVFRLYVGKRVPDEHQLYGPVGYTW